jgi:hypothetical protein
MNTGTWKISEVVTEITRYGEYVSKMTREIVIAECQYIAGGYSQTERVWRNSQLLTSAQYPANTDYAAMRRQGIVK